MKNRFLSDDEGEFGREDPNLHDLRPRFSVGFDRKRCRLARAQGEEDGTQAKAQRFGATDLTGQRSGSGTRTGAMTP
jgi:hypothetical protein